MSSNLKENNNTPSNRSLFIFLDRDGTINEDYGYVTSPDKVTLIPDAANAIAKFKELGATVIIVSNQSAISRGMATEYDVEITNQELIKQLLNENPNALIDLILWSPDGPDDLSSTRKPEIGMFLHAKKELMINPENCWIIGDKISDIEFGINAGFPENQCLLVLTGQGEENKIKLFKKYPSTICFKNLLQASMYISKSITS